MMDATELALREEGCDALLAKDWPRWEQVCGVLGDLLEDRQDVEAMACRAAWWETRRQCPTRGGPPWWVALAVEVPASRLRHASPYRPPVGARNAAWLACFPSWTLRLRGVGAKALRFTFSPKGDAARRQPDVSERHPLGFRGLWLREVETPDFPGLPPLYDGTVRE